MKTSPATAVLLTVLLTLTRRTVFPAAVRNQHILIAGNGEPDASITDIDRLHPGTQSTYSFDGYSISSACVSHPARCRDLEVYANSNLSQHIVLTPLQTAIGLIDFEYEMGKFIHRATHVVNFTGGGQLLQCTPLAVIKHRSSGFFTVCFVRHTLYLCDIMLDKDNITRSYTRCSTQLPINDFDPALVSNFVFVSPGNEGHYAFAYGTTLYKVFPERHVFGGYVHGLDSEHVVGPCQYLVNTGDHLVAYCAQNNNITIAVVYNVIVEDWEYNTPDIPYICPNQRSNVTTLPSESYIHYNITFNGGSTDTRINVTGTNLYLGVCFDYKDYAMFAYLDRAEGLFLLNLTSNVERHLDLPNQICTDYSVCEMRRVGDDGRYILVKQQEPDGHSTVVLLDGEREYTSIITINNTPASLVAVIPYLEQEIPDPPPQTTDSQYPTNLTTTTMDQDTLGPNINNGGHEQTNSENIRTITAGVSAAVLTILLLAAGVSLAIFVYRKFWGKKKNFAPHNSGGSEGDHHVELTPRTDLGDPESQPGEIVTPTPGPVSISQPPGEHHDDTPTPVSVSQPPGDHHDVTPTPVSVSQPPGDHHDVTPTPVSVSQPPGDHHDVTCTPVSASQPLGDQRDVTCTPVSVTQPDGASGQLVDVVSSVMLPHNPIIYHVIRASNTPSNNNNIECRSDNNNNRE